ncbi:hypothetical protein CHS0354_016961 [Potamilus streckersoni]|uniref:Uncharacterized protein n=1 Tax=Potamilus streckersoni TaxID=2493646 RepID=A0AAE0VR11_9BIVA|nr:hypothetical protein CHS0354_016961 [Potamilus streckersoni]
MMRFLFLAPLFYELRISVVLSALQNQKGNTETEKYGGSFHERLSRMEAIVLADNALNERLSNLENEIKRIGEENKLLRDVVKNQDYSLKHLADEIRELQSDNGELKRFCKETYGRMISRIEDESYQNILLANEPQARNTTEIINPLRLNIIKGRTKRKYKVASPLDQDARNRNRLGDNDLFQPRQTSKGLLPYIPACDERA